jgi:hypothetical protein
MLGFRLAPALKPAFLTDDHLDPLYRNSEYVSDTALGLDDARCAGVAFELAAQAKNLHVDAAVEDILVNAGRLQQMIATKRPQWRFEKGEQHCILTVRQCDLCAGRVGESAALTVELPAQKSKAATLAIARRRHASDIEPSQHRADAREQLAQIEWFRQIIVGTEFQPNHPIDVFAAVTSDNDDGQLGVQPDVPQEIESVVQA